MSTTTTGTMGSYPTSITIPSDGDPRDAASVNVALQALADRTEHLKNGSAGWYNVPLNQPSVNINSRWTGSLGVSLDFAWHQTNVTDDGNVIWYVPTHLDGRMTDVQAVVDGNGAGASHTNVPGAGDLPKIQLLQFDAVTGTFSSVAAAVEDAPADLAAYEVVHVFGHSGLTADFDRDTQYAIRWRGEKGVNAVASALALYQIRILIEPV